MSALTRILNNQIFNQTIIASQKIQPGSITGTLFASNVTVPGDLLIAGNLFVLGSSQTTTIASTNTYVNDPLVVLNNGFAGTNTYDEGLIFNRGTADNKAFIWSETFKEFRLITTAEAGTTYGNVNAIGLANLSVGKFLATGVSTLANAVISEATVTAANISTIYGDTLNIAGNVLLGLTRAAAINSTPIGNIAASTGAFTTLFASGQVTFSANTASTNTGTGALIVNGGVGIGGNLFLGGNLNVIGNSFVISSNSGVFYGNAVGAGALYAGVIGYTPQDFTTIQSSGNADNYIQINLQNINSGQNASTDFVATADNGTQTDTFIDMGINSSTYNAAGYELSKPNDGYLYVHGNLTTGGGNLVLGTWHENDIVFATAGLSTPNEQARFKNNVGLIISRTTASTTTTSGALQVAGGVGIAGNLNVGGNLVVNSPTLLNSSLTSTGIVTFNNTTNSTEAGATSGALRVAGGGSIAKDLWVGGNIYASNIFGVTHQIITVQDPLVYFDAANTFPYNYDIGFYSNFVGPNPIDNTGNAYQHSGVVRDNSDNTWKFFSNVRSEPDGTAITFDSDTIFDPIRAGNLTLTYTQDSTSATTGSFKTAGGVGIGGNIFQTGTRLETSASNFLLLNTPTTIDAFGQGSTINLGSTSGTVTIKNPTIVGASLTQTLFDTVATTINFGRTSNITLGTPSGVTSVQGGANIQATTASTNAGTGALKVQGGVGVRGNLNIDGHTTGALTVGLNAAGGTLYPENLVQFTSNSNSASRVSIQNISTQQAATSEFVAVSSNGSNVSGFLVSGITSINYNSELSGPVLKPLDSYVLTNGGNLVIASGDNKDIVFASNGLGNTGVRISADFANVGVQYLQDSSSATTGAFTVVGGMGVSGNVWFGKGLQVNSTNSSSPFSVWSSTFPNVAIAAYTQPGLTSTTESVIIGGGNLTVQPGCILKVSGVTSMMVPVGPTGARPSSQGANDVAGMLRFNTTTTSLEFYDGTDWNIAGSVFTVISGRQFSGNVAGGFGNVDGTNTTFTLQGEGTTAGTIISINGVMQFPTLAYSVTGNVLTFTEPPAPGDVIDARILTTTASVSSITNGNGINQLIADDEGTAQWTGTSDGGTIRRTLVDTAGNFNLQNGTDITYNQTAVNIAANNTPYVIATRSQTTFTSAKFIVSAKRGTGATGNVETYEAQVITDGDGNAYISTYGVVNNGYAMGELSANVLAGNVQVYYTGVIAASVVQANVKCFGTYIL